MPKASRKDPEKNGGSSSQDGKEGIGGEGEVESKKVLAIDSGTVDPSVPPDQQEGKAKEKKRRGRAPTEGQALKRVLVFLSEPDVAALKAEVGDRGVSTKIREIVKEYLERKS
jgi:hypothetical protein